MKGILKFYMNNPCEVIRTISDDFSEVKVYPQFDDEMIGENWCIECMVGNQGTPSSHTCDQYQEILDAIREQETAMIIVVENRLLNDKPVEFKAWNEVRRKLKENSKKKDELLKESIAIEASIKRQSQILVDVNEEIEDAKFQASSIREKLNNREDQLRSIDAMISEKQDQVSVGGIQLSLTGSDIRRMIEAEIKLEYLNNGGVDSWEWYDESTPSSDELDNLVQDRINSISVKGIK